jgi:serine/threonine protein phosphatase 1
MKRFVIGDIHGGYLALVQALERCKFDYENDELITLGDITDGWSQTYECVEELLKIKYRIDIVGNHDDWFIDFINTTTHPDKWSQGGIGTAKSYAKAAGVELIVDTRRIGYGVNSSYEHQLNLIPSDIPPSHRNFFKRQARYYKDDDGNVFVHGGFDRSGPINKTHRDTMMWDRKLLSQSMSAESSKTKLKYYEDDIKNVFIGHTSTLSWNTTEPIKADILWNLDTGGGSPNGKVTIMDIDTKEYWQSDLLGELYPDESNNR